MKKTIVLLALSALSLDLYSYTPTQPNLDARAWFSGARFGLFIHWGIYSQLSHGEWVMENQKIPLKNYEKLAPLFNPYRFNAQEWVDIAKSAGMRYITITSKHHDGFAMFGTKQNNWNIVDQTSYGKDVLKLLADACHEKNVKLFFYYSQLDWHHIDYFPRGWTGNTYNSRTNNGKWQNYLQFMNNQLTELLTNYGPIAGIWFDGWWDKPWENWDLKNTFDLIHQLQPHALIGSNHHAAPFEGQDFQMFEQDLPGQNTAGFNDKSSISQLPLETCLTITKRAWGVNLIDAKDGFRTTKELIHMLAGAAGRSANLLLNVGPLPDGTFPEEAKKLLGEIGAWLKTNGEAIYETIGGPITPRAWGVTTQSKNKIYVHILNWHNQDLLWLPIKQVKKSYYLINKKHADSEILHNGILLKNIVLYDPHNTVIVLELDK